MKYLVVQTSGSSVLDTYLPRNVDAVVKKLKSYQKIFVPETKVKAYFGKLSRFKRFCVNTLPYTRNGKMKHKIYKANVELVPV